MWLTFAKRYCKCQIEPAKGVKKLWSWTCLCVCDYITGAEDGNHNQSNWNDVIPFNKFEYDNYYRFNLGVITLNRKPKKKSSINRLYLAVVLFYSLDFRHLFLFSWSEREIRMTGKNLLHLLIHALKEYHKKSAKWNVCTGWQPAKAKARNIDEWTAGKKRKLSKKDRVKNDRKKTMNVYFGGLEWDPFRFGCSFVSQRFLWLWHLLTNVAFSLLP